MKYRVTRSEAGSETGRLTDHGVSKLPCKGLHTTRRRTWRRRIGRRRMGSDHTVCRCSAAAYERGRML